MLKSTPSSDPYGRDPRFRDLRNFVCHIWRHIIGRDPSPLQYEYCYFLQHGGTKQFLSAYRGYGKSFLAVAYAVWILYWEPNKKILMVSASQTFANELSTFAFQCIRSVPGLDFLDCQGKERHSKVSFDVGPAIPDKQPSVKSIGVGGQLTGNRADVLISDDVETTANSDTQAAREKLANAIKEYAAIIKPGGQIVYLGTPQSESSIYNLLPGRGYTVRLWPIVYPDAGLAASQKDVLAPSILEALESGANPGDPTDPTRFNELAVAERRAEYGKTGFALQFQLDTSLANADRFPLKLRDLMVIDCSGPMGPEALAWSNAPQNEIKHIEAKGLDGDRLFAPIIPEGTRFSPWTSAMMFVDPSGTGRDETGYAVVKYLNGNLFVAECTGLAGGYSDTVLAALAQAAKRHAVSKIVVEANWGDGMFERLLQPHVLKVHPCAIEGLKVSQQKEMRILDTLEPVFGQHRIAVDPRVFEGDGHRSGGISEQQAHRYLLAYQLTRLTRERGALAQDDRVDALSGAVGLWTEALSQDRVAAQARARERLKEQELKDFMDGVLGRPPSPVSRGSLRHNRALGYRPRPSR